MQHLSTIAAVLALIRAAWPVARAIKRKTGTWQAANLSLVTDHDLWPPGSVIDPQGRGCTHAGSAPCHYHGRHL